MRTALCLLLGRSGFFAAFIAPAWAAIPAGTTVSTVTPIESVEPVATPLVTLAVAVDLAHHRGGAFFVLVDTDGQIAQHVFGETLLALDFGECGRRRIELQHGEVRLAVLPDAEREGFDAPIFRVGDEFPAEAFDDALVGGGHLLDLLRAQVLAREVDVFVQRHDLPFPYVCSFRRQAPHALREGKRSSQEGGNTGRRTMRSSRMRVQKRAACTVRPFSSRPGSSGSGGYSGIFPAGKRAIGQRLKRIAQGVLLFEGADAVRDFDCHYRPRTQ